MSKAIGIDLGTTNTVAAEVQHERAAPAVIQTRDYVPLTRSVVAYDRGVWRVGKDAEEVGRYAPSCAIASTKRFIGLNFDDERIHRDMALLNRDPARPRAVAAPDGEIGVRFRFYPDGSPTLDLSPVEVATLILKQVKADAEGATGAAVTHAVITAPAYFDAARIEATRQAGEAAGLHVQRIISEPLAAALAYGMRLDASVAETVVVFDMGGGTLDVTVCAIGKNECVELAKDGDNHLGGDDLDSRIEQLVFKRLRDASGIEFSGPESSSPEILQTLSHDLRYECRGAKERLSNVDEATIRDAAWRRHPKAGVPGTGPVNITRAEFEVAIADLVEQAMRVTQQALAKAGCTPADINRVLLVGGSTYVPVIRERLRALFGAEKVRIDVNPMEAVAYGAALLAATLPNLTLCPHCHTDQPADANICQKCGATLVAQLGSASATGGGLRLQVVSTTARTISVKTALGNLQCLFASGSQYSPTDGASLTKAREPFRLAASGTRTLTVEFYEGEGDRADGPGVAFYAEFTINGLPLDTRQGEEVILDATLNGDGSLAGTVTFRGRAYPYVASPSRWRGELADLTEQARLLLPNMSDLPARASLQQAIDHAEDVAIERDSDARAGRAARIALLNAVEEAVSDGSPEMEKLSRALFMASAMFEYGGEWVNLLPSVTAPAVRDLLLSESQLLSALRPAVLEGRQIQAQNETAYAERATERIEALTYASDLLYPLALARILSEYAENEGRKNGLAGDIITAREWDRLRQRDGSRQAGGANLPAGTKRQCAQDLGAVLEQMHVAIVSDPALFQAQFLRVVQLMDAFYAARD